MTKLPVTNYKFQIKIFPFHPHISFPLTRPRTEKVREKYLQPGPTRCFSSASGRESSEIISLVLHPFSWACNSEKLIQPQDARSRFPRFSLSQIWQSENERTRSPFFSSEALISLSLVIWREPVKIEDANWCRQLLEAGLCTVYLLYHVKIRE